MIKKIYLLKCYIRERTGLKYLNDSEAFLNIQMIWMIVCSCHVTYAFQSEFTLYSFLNVKELLDRSRHRIWSLSDCNWTRAHNHLVHKRTLNHLAILANMANGWVFVYELSDCGFEPSRSHLSLCHLFFRFIRTDCN